MTGVVTGSSHLKIIVIGLGYVGLPLAVELAKYFDVTGLDIDTVRVNELRAGVDRTREVDAAELRASTIRFATSPGECAAADVYIVTVPTPINAQNQPDLSIVLNATRMVAGMIDASRTPVIVYESTVYPGVTEDICGPLLAAKSGLVRSRDFFLGYSPERINPGDKDHGISRITKVIAGENDQITEQMAHIYGAITTGGVFRAASIKAAEAAKVIENAQRDINIAFMNEITRIFGRLDLSIWDVLDAAQTKWNFLPFQPGLVGGHCIGVDPYYLSHRASQLGCDADVILSGRSVNDAMGGWIAEQVDARLHGGGCNILVMGLTFKENVPDLRNSKSIDVVRALAAKGHRLTIHDPLASQSEAVDAYSVEIDPDALARQYDGVVALVAHDHYRALDPATLTALVRPGGLLVDIRRMWPFLNGAPAGLRYWSM